MPTRVVGPQPSETPSDPPTFPRTYRPPPAYLVFSRVFAAALLAVGFACVGTLAGWWPMHFRGAADAAAWATFCGIGLAGGAYVLYAMHKVRITLEADAVEIVSYGTPLATFRLRPPVRLRRADIARRTMVSRRGGQLMILHGRGGTTIRVPMIFRTDATFRNWFKPIPLTPRRKPWFSRHRAGPHGA